MLDSGFHEARAHAGKAVPLVEGDRDDLGIEHDGGHPRPQRLIHQRQQHPRTDTFTVIPPGLTRTLRFNVTVGTTATVDTVTVSGVVNGTINGIPVSDNIAETLSGWRVKTE